MRRAGTLPPSTDFQEPANQPTSHGVLRQRICIGSRVIDSSAPALVVAELSANHSQRLDIALRTIDAAAAAGADAIKLQTYKPETITFHGDGPMFRIESANAWNGRTYYDLYEEAHTPWEWHAELFAHAKALGLICFSSPFDPTAIDLLESLESPDYKVASFEITDTPLIQQMAATGKPVIISTGIATLDDIQAALDACRKAGNDQVILLKCTSAYPADPGESNLATMVDMAQRFGVLAGLSDHTLDHVSATTAVALGACLIEKHFILDRKLGGPDSAFSLEPSDFREMVRLIRATEAAVGEVTYELTDGARANRRFSRSLFVVQDVRAGDAVTATNVRSIRPNDGLPPATFDSLDGRRFARDVAAGTPLSLDLLRP